MQFTISLAKQIDPVAIYAAIVSTLVFAWNIYVWRNSGPKLKVTASMNMIIIGGGYQDPDTYITVNGTNVGAKKTTVTNVLISSYDSWWQVIRNRPSWNAIFNHSDLASPLPFVLDVGHTFNSRAVQNAEIEKRIKETYFYAGLAHSFGKPVMVRLKYSDPKPKKTSASVTE